MNNVLSDAPNFFRTRRAGLWGGPAAFFLFCLLVFVGAPDASGRVFYAVMSLLTGLWLVRAWRAGVEMTSNGVLIRGQFRTRRFSWNEIVHADRVPMRTASPFRARWPYVALALELSDGRTRRFDDVSASGHAAPSSSSSLTRSTSIGRLPVALSATGICADLGDRFAGMPCIVMQRV